MLGYPTCTCITVRGLTGESEATSRSRAKRKSPPRRRTGSTRRQSAATVPLPQPVRFPVMLQRWQDVSFVHWRCDADVIAGSLPARLTIDTHDGSAWMSFVLFRMRMSPPRFNPPFGVGLISESNLRTYVVDTEERRGVYFFSLDANKTVFAALARLLFFLPYHGVDMSVRKRRDTFSYSLQRHNVSTGPEQPTLDAHVRHGAVIASHRLTTLDHFLTARYSVYTNVGAAVFRQPLEHRPWVLRRATSARLTESLTDAAGVPAAGGEMIWHGADPVDVRMGAPRPLR